jgi:aromatic ring hydroxylase
MCGEWQFSRDQAWLFGVFHRLYGAASIPVDRELKLGTAALMAEYNGLDRYPHIQEKLAWLAMDTVILDVMCKAACEHPDVFPDIGLVAPNTVYTNIAKFRYWPISREALLPLSFPTKIG